MHSKDFPMDDAPRISDLIPQSRRTYVVCARVGLALTILFGALHVASNLWLAASTTDGSVAAFDLDSEGNLATWFTASLLFLAGQMTLVVRTGMTPRRDRSPGLRTGLLLVAILWFVMSADEVGSLHEGFKEIMARLAGTRVFGDGSVYWAVPYAVAITVACGFLLIRMKGTAPRAWLCAACTLWAVAVLHQFEWFWAAPVWGVLIEETCEMLAAICLLGALCLWAKRVFQQPARDRSQRPAIDLASDRAGDAARELLVGANQ